MTPPSRCRVLLLWLLISFIGTSAPSSPGQLDPDYRPRFVKAGGYLALHPSPNGGYVAELGPEVVKLGGYEVRRLARINVDGSIVSPAIDPAFLTNASFSLVLPQPGGKTWVEYGPAAPIYPRTPVRFLRLNPDGTRDQSFQLPVQTEADDWRLMAIQPDGKILAAVKRPATLLVDRYRLLRLQPDGRIDPTFMSDVDGARILAVSVLADGRMLVEFTPTVFHEAEVSEWTRLLPGGSTDTSFHPAPANFAIGSFSAVSPDGEILIAIYGTDQSLLGGGFGTVHPFVRLQADGSLDPDFHPAVSPGQFVSFLPEGHLLVKTTAPTTGIASVAELNHDGSLVTSVPLAMTANLGQYLNITVLPTSDYLVQNAGAPKIYSPQGTLLRTFDFGPKQAVQPPVPAAFPDGSLIFGRGGSANPNFEEVNRLTVSGPALVDPSGQPDAKFSLLTQGQAQWRMLQGGDGKVLAYDSRTQMLIAVGRDNSLHYLGSRGTALGFQEGQQLQWQSDGTMVFAGDTYVYRILPDGTESGAAGAGGFGNIHGFKVLSDDRLLLWGTSSFIAGLPANGIAQLRADLVHADLGFRASSSPRKEVLLAQPQPDGKVVVFYNAHTNNSTNLYRLSRLNADGSLDTRFRAGLAFDGAAKALRLDSQGRILVAGAFHQVAGQYRGCVVRLLPDGTPDAGFDSGIGPDAPVEHIFLLPTDDVVLLGGFRRFSGTEAWGLVKLQGGPVVGGAPVIASLTAGPSVHAGDSLSLGAMITGTSPMLYQWFHDGVALEGETNAILTLHHVSADQGGGYSLFVANGAGVDAASTSLTLQPPENGSGLLTFLDKPVSTPSWITVGLVSDTTNRFRLQVSTNLTVWQAVATSVPLTANRASTLVDPFGDKPGPRFVRAFPQ